MRAIGYYRFRDEDEDEATEEHHERFEQYCQRYLHQPVAIFGDALPSGNGPFANGNGNGRESVGHKGRLPQYGRMLEHIVSSRSNYLVVVPDTTHLGDDLEEVVRTIIEIEATGCKVICEDDEIPDPLQNALDSLGPAGVSKERSERIKDSMRRRAMLGKGLGKPPFGYRNSADGTLEVVEHEASTVRLIYEKYIDEGLGLRLIAQYLNERDIKTRRGGRWNMVTIRDILRNPNLYGHVLSIRPSPSESTRGNHQPEDIPDGAGPDQGETSFFKVGQHGTVSPIRTCRVRVLRQQDDGSHPKAVLETKGWQERPGNLPLLPVPEPEQPEPVWLSHLACRCA